jgi:sulfatase maturation enzyme AslB (radical SAM superfamily)
MCVRNIQGGKVSPWLELNEITLNQFKEWFSKDFLKQLLVISLCGNTGDPIIASDTLEILKWIRQVNPNIKLNMNTNGSARTSAWWKDLASVNVTVMFGIDGSADTHKLYRIGTDYDRILRNATEFINAGGQAEWHMLVFEHNQHEIEACRILSEKLKFKKFVVKHSARFRNNNLVVLHPAGSYTINPSGRSKEIQKKINILQNSTNISCKVKKEGNIYIGANGNVTACCWLDFSGMAPTSELYADYVSRDFMTPSLLNTNLSEIFKSNYFNKIEKLWNNNPLKTCSKQCGEIDKFNEQFK